MSGFEVRPFAFMRLTHEALRAGFQAIRQAAADGDLQLVDRELLALRRAIDLHARHEEEVFFPLLDRLFDGAVFKAGLRDAHEREDDFQARLESALASGDVGEVQAAVDAWGPSFEQHLTDEEDVMMPLTQRVADTIEGRAAAVREIVELDWETLVHHQLPYVLRSLSDTKPYGPLRMYVAAVQASTGERWAELEPVVRSTVAPEKVDLLAEHGHLSAAR